LSEWNRNRAMRSKNSGTLSAVNPNGVNDGRRKHAFNGDKLSALPVRANG
jgi:hypothetical protein